MPVYHVPIFCPLACFLQTSFSHHDAYSLTIVLQLKEAMNEPEDDTEDGEIIDEEDEEED